MTKKERKRIAAAVVREIGWLAKEWVDHLKVGGAFLRNRPAEKFARDLLRTAAEVVRRETR